MSQIQRYDYDEGWMCPHHEGEYVKWEDVEKFLAVRAAEAAEVEWARTIAADNETMFSAKAWMVEKLREAREATNTARRAAGIKENA